MSSDQEYKDQRDRAERQRVRDRIKKEMGAIESQRSFVVQIVVDPKDPNAAKSAEFRLREISGVLNVWPL